MFKKPQKSLKSSNEGRIRNRIRNFREYYPDLKHFFKSVPDPDMRR
jgi:hypothetical protein